MGKFGIGQAVERVEDARLLTGHGRYTDDISLDNQAYGVVLRSPHAHAEIRAIDTAAAKTAPGVLGVYTAADIDAVSPALESSAKRPARLPRFHSPGAGASRPPCRMPHREMRFESSVFVMVLLFMMMHLPVRSCCF